MHDRGLIHHSKTGEKLNNRGSVWIEQEIAIAAFLKNILQRDLKVAAYIQRGIGREGVREHLHLNPVEFDTNVEILSHLNKQIKDWKLVGSQKKAITDLNSGWFAHHRQKADEKKSKWDLQGLMDIRCSLPDRTINIDQAQLVAALKQVQNSVTELRLAPRSSSYPASIFSDGIVQEIDNKPYSYCALGSNGDVFSVHRIFEDIRGNANSKEIFDNVRMHEITEVLIFCVRYYQALGLPMDTRVKIAIRHDGLSNREISCSEELGMFAMKITGPKTAHQDSVTTEVVTTLAEINSNLLAMVKQFGEPLLKLFNLHKLIDKDYLHCINWYREHQAGMAVLPPVSDALTQR
jgi:hypothetical protein